ncbi:hypothetical protein BDR05DRAFT_620231 [Suillus weaverae]|nr:hypothetical protein BDR05DRAFT_620231 [Suillus weaverae]
MTGGTSLQGRSTSFHIVCHALILQSSYTRTIKKAGRMKPKSASGQRRQVLSGYHQHKPR